MQSRHYAISNNPLWAWWRDRSIASVEHEAVIQRVVEEARWTSRYAFMVVISAGISILGLLLPSSAVLIGAMLISPLMMPIIGLGFALATLDFDEMRRAGFALGAGSLIAILLSAGFVALSPVQTVTSEIAIRTHPNLFDLLVALLSALAGGYALIRGRGETVVGVAIAIALMPPLAVVGFGIATWNWTIAGGALLLFITNFITIALTAAFVARLYGFGSHLTPAHTRLQSILMVVGMTALAVPLALALRQIAWETLASRQIRDAVQAQFPDNARLSDMETDFRAHPIKVVATVLTPAFTPGAEQKAEARLGAALRRSVKVDIDQLRVGGGVGEAEAAQVTAAQSRESSQAVDRAAARVVDRLALVAGVAPEAVVVDRVARRATVTAAAIANADLGLYRQLERRAASGMDGWTLMLIPPALPLPSVSFSGAVPDDAGQAAIDLVAWAARRQMLPITLSGSPTRTQAVADALAERGIDPRRFRRNPSRSGEVRLHWRLPDGS